MVKIVKEICFITNKYPNISEPNVLVFLQQLIWSIADLGYVCTVIAPMPVNIYPKYIKQPYHTVETTENGNKVDVYWPKYSGFGDEHRVLGWSPARLTADLFTRAAIKTIKKENIVFDVVYAHFLEPAGVAAARIGEKYNKPSFVAFGEATFTTMNCFGTNELRKEFESLSGVVAVATQNKEMLLSRNVVPEEKIGVFPNGYRPERFYPRDKLEARKHFGLPEDAFIVGFVGSFDNRKGINRLEAAIEKVDGAYMICAGKGDIIPKTEKCLWFKPVNNDELPWFYSAADVFVLPTLHEGCCNAIVEAIACGLPIISSNRRFNDDILNDSCSLRIDPESVHEIVEAIETVKNDVVLREQLSSGSLKKRDELTLNQRAVKICQFMEINSISKGK